MTLVLAAVAAFLATNVDDLVLFAVDPSPRDVVAGQALGFALLVVVSVAGALGAAPAPAWVIRGLGAVPLAMGLLLLVRGGEEDDEVLPTTPRCTSRSSHGPV